MRALVIVLWAIWAISASAPLVHAQTITEDRPLSYGIFGLNTALNSGDLRIDQFGSTLATGDFFILQQGEQGLYTVTGLPASTSITVSGSEMAPLTNGGAPPAARFNLVSFHFPPSNTSDPSGVLTFGMGATIETNTTSSQYPGGTYSGTILVTVTFP